MGQVLFVVWRESFEALLVIGIIYGWIKQHPDARNGIKFLKIGVYLGIAVSILLALLIYGTFNVINDISKSLFIILMEVVACILIVQMVCWMRKHSNSIKDQIEFRIKGNIVRNNWWRVTLLITIAIAREGSEIVVFLSSFIMSLTSISASIFFIEVVVGILIASLTLYVFLLTNNFISLRVFFKVTSIILLFFALSLLLNSVEEISNLLIELDYPIPEFLIHQAWNTGTFFEDYSQIDNFISSFFAYRSQPIWLSVIAFIFYWIVVVMLFLWSKKHA
ncbi:MAG: FTR1 family protein [Arsenophonus sp.]